MKKLIIIILVVAPLFTLAQGKGVPERNQSKAELTKYTTSAPREFAQIEKIQTESRFMIKTTVKSRDDKHYNETEFDTMMEALNYLGQLGFELKASESYTQRENHHNVFYLEREAPLKK